LKALVGSVFDSAGLPPKSLHDLMLVHFLISCVENNLCETVSKILFGIDINMQRTQEENRSILRGSINWGATIQHRIGMGYPDRTLFVTNNHRRDYDTLSNQTIRFLLTKFVIYSDHFLKNNKTKHEDAWVNQIARHAIKAIALLGHPKIQSATLIPRLTFSHVEAVSLNRIANYKKIGPCAKLYYNIFCKKSAQAIQELIMSRVLAPIETDAIYEFAVLFKTLECLEGRMKKGDRKSYVVMRAAEKTIFEYTIDNTLYKVHYQNVPEWIESDCYSPSLKAHGCTASSLRPDIFVTSQHTSGRRACIIEVKYSLKSSYVFDGLKDVLAYLYDFGPVDIADDGCILLAMYLPTPGKRGFPGKVWIAGHDQLDSTLSELFDRLGSTVMATSH
jgi:hypothetical protein